MAFTVEDGSGVTDSNAFCGVTFADDYHADRGNADWKGAKQEKQRAIVRATDYLEQQGYRGYKVDEEQSLEWPREDVRVNDTLLANDAVPLILQRVTAELAMAALSGDLNPDALEGRVSSESEKSGKLSKTITFDTDDSPRFRKVMAMLRPLTHSLAHATLNRV